MKVLAVLILSLFAVSAEKARFDNYQIHTVNIETQKQYEAFQYLEANSDAYEFFDPIHMGEIEVLVPPHMRSHFGDISQTLGFKSKLINANYQDLIDNENPKVVPANFGWTAYYSYAEISAWIDSLTSHSGVTVETIATSTEGRPIKMVSIQRNPNNRHIIIEANIHAREWISHSTTTWIINELLTSTNATVQNMANTINWHFIPVMNPDGFEFTRLSNRNWRKNRAVASALCFGIDGNRNFAFNWLVRDEGGNLGASTSPCSDTFAGDSSLSQPETIALDQIMDRYHDKTDIFLSMHAYGHYLLHSWGTNRTQAPNYQNTQEVGFAIRDAIRVRDNITYAVGSTITLLYAASGSSPDHAVGKYQIPLSYTFEMRGNGAYGNHGFVLPANLILPNSLEVFDGFIAMVSSARARGYLQQP